MKLAIKPNKSDRTWKVVGLLPLNKKVLCLNPAWGFSGWSLNVLLVSAWSVRLVHCVVARVTCSCSDRPSVNVLVSFPSYDDNKDPFIAKIHRGQMSFSASIMNISTEVDTMSVEFIHRESEGVSSVTVEPFTRKWHVICMRSIIAIITTIAPVLCCNTVKAAVNKGLKTWEGKCCWMCSGKIPHFDWLGWLVDWLICLRVLWPLACCLLE